MGQLVEVTLEIDAELKEQAEKVLAENGLTIGELIEKFRPLVERARELLPVPEVQQPEQEQERGHTWGGMEL